MTKMLFSYLLPFPTILFLMKSFPTRKSGWENPLCVASFGLLTKLRNKRKWNAHNLDDRICV